MGDCGAQWGRRLRLGRNVRAEGWERTRERALRRDCHPGGAGAISLTMRLWMERSVRSEPAWAQSVLRLSESLHSSFDPSHTRNFMSPSA